MTIFVDAVPGKDEIGNIAPVSMPICVGFGVAQVTKNGVIIFAESMDKEKFHTLDEFEKLANLEPDADWRILLDAPLKRYEYKRNDKGQWVVIQVGPGFA